MKPAPFRSRRRGAILVFAMIALVLISVSMIPVAQYVRQTSNMAFSTRGSDQAFYAAEAGIARGISLIFAAGAGTIQGINENEFNATEDNPYYPWGEEWLTLDPGVDTDDDAKLSCKVSVYFEPAEAGWIIRSVGRSLLPSENYRDVRVTIGGGTFARYSFFNTTSLSAMDGLPRWLAPGETFTGPVHSNRHLFNYGTFSPNKPLTFNSDVTIVGSEVRQSGSNNQNVVYKGLKDTNAGYVELPSNPKTLRQAAKSGGLDLPGDDPSIATPPANWPASDPNPTINNYKFTFNSDGTLTYKNLDLEAFYRTTAGGNKTAATAATLSTTTIDLSSINGAVVVNDGNAIVSGTLNGRVTLAALVERSDPNDLDSGNASTALQSYTASKTDGNIIVDGNLVYHTHPLVSGSYDTSDNRTFNPKTVTDALGLIAERNFAIDGSVPTNAVVDAHIMITGQASPNPDVRNWNQTTNTSTVITPAINQDGAFYIEDGVQRDLSERWTGITDDESGNGSSEWSGSGTTGNLYLTGGIVHFIRGQTANGDGGYTRKYVFDTRFLTDPPPFYPLTPDLEIFRWRDVASKTEP